MSYDEVFVSDLVTDPEDLAPEFGVDSDHPVQGLFDRHDPWFALKVTCCVVWVPLWTTIAYPLARIPLLPVWLTYIAAGTLLSALTTAVSSVESTLCPDPRRTFDKDRALVLGAILDEDGNVVGRDRPLRPSTLLLLFVSNTQAWIILFAFFWGACLAVWYLFSLEKFTIIEVNKRSFLAVS